jgi:hypothetical protein
MEHINNFSKGLNTDNSEIDQPNGTYRYMLNGVHISEEGDIFNPTNEKGTLSRVNNFPSGFKINGGTVLDTDFIVFLVDPINGYSQIGIIDNTFSYERRVPSTDTGNQLGLSIEHQVSCQARKLLTGDRIVYFCDYNMPMGFVNLDSPPSDTDLLSQSKLFPDQKIPVIDLVDIEETSGALIPGVVQFVTRYKTSTLNPTTFGIPCNPIPVIDNRRAEGRNKYDGEYYDYGPVSKSIKIRISNVDTSYPFLEVVVIYYDNATNTFVAKALPLINISADSVELSYNGEEQNVTDITQSELNQISVSYDTAKCMTQKDDMLFISNLKDSNATFDEELQNIANNIHVTYRIEEQEYLDGSTGINTLSFDLVGDPYITANPTDKVYLLFNKPVDMVFSTVVANYELKSGGSTWNPTGVVVDPTNNRVLVLSFGIATIDPTYTLKVTVVYDYVGIEDYDSGGLYLPLTIGQPIESDPLSSTNGILFNDYKNEYLCFSKKSFQRDEVYHLLMGVVWADGSSSFGYSIPASNSYYRSLPDLSAINIGTDTIIKAIPLTPGSYSGDTTGELGVYRSELEYPSGQNFPTTIDPKIRHHKMPSLQQEPHFRYESSSGRTYIRILGLDFKFNILPSSQLSSRIQSVVIYRQRRNSNQNRSILAQGLINRFVETANDYEYGNGNEIVSSKVYKKVPFFNNTILGQQDVSMPGVVGTRHSAGFLYAYNGTTGIYNDKFAFSSPETLFRRVTEEDVTGAKIRSVLKLKGRISRELVERSKNERINHTVYEEFVINSFLRLHLLNNYYAEDTGFIADEKTVSNSVLVKKGEIRTIDSIKLDNSLSEDVFYIKTDSDFSEYGLNTSISATIKAYFGMSPNTVRENDDIISIPTGDYNHNLYNVVLENTQQYGPISSSECIPIYRTNNIPSPTSDTIFSVFGGDVFISKFAYINKDLYRYRAAYDKVFLTVGTVNWDNNPGTEILPIDGNSGKGMDLRAISYYFTESQVNCNYRHQFQDRRSSVAVAGVKYYPRYSALEVLAEDPRNGDSDSYNTQYSFENTVKPIYTKPQSYTSIGTFSNRTIYSEKAKQDDLTDNYRVFLQNNYHDIPKHTGDIWNTFVHNNTFYIHTTKSLWRTFVNEISTQVTSIGEVVQGTGGVFSMPSKEVLTSMGGYAGTISQFGGTHTPFGYVFPDALQGKVFILNEGLEEISQHGMMQYFSNNLLEGLIGNTYIDNPCNPDSAGIIGVFDYDSKRYILVKRGTSRDLTMSYSLLNKKWVSFHSYKPHFLISSDSRLFGFTNDTVTTEMHEHNVGDRGLFYNNPIQPFDIHFVFNPLPKVSKSFDNMFVQAMVEDDAGNYIDLDFFNTIRCKNYTKNTGLITLTCTNAFGDNSNVKKKSDQYQLAIPRNALNADPIFPDRMTGKFMTVELSYNNLSNNKILLNFVELLYKQVPR